MCPRLPRVRVRPLEPAEEYPYRVMDPFLLPKRRQPTLPQLFACPQLGERGAAPKKAAARVAQKHEAPSESAGPV